MSQGFHGGDAQYVAFKFAVQAVVFQNNIQRLVPWHIIQHDGQCALDVWIEHDVKTADLVDQAEEIFQIYIFQVDRYRLACVMGTCGGRRNCGRCLRLERHILAQQRVQRSACRRRSVKDRVRWPGVELRCSVVGAGCGIHVGCDGVILGINHGEIGSLGGGICGCTGLRIRGLCFRSGIDCCCLGRRRCLCNCRCGYLSRFRVCLQVLGRRHCCRCHFSARRMQSDL